MAVLESVGAGLPPEEVAQCYQCYGHLVLRRCRLQLRDVALAEDALQEAFVKLVRYGAQYRQADHKLRWLYRVADRCCYDLLAKRSRRREVAQDEVAFPEANEPVPPNQDAVAAMRQAVLGMLAALDEGERRVALLCYLDGLNQGEIARETGWSRQTVNKKLHAIRQRAQRCVAGWDNP